jgi:uncharacterized protein YggE
MKHLIVSLLLACGAMTLAAQTPPAPRPPQLYAETVSVSGSARVGVTPDRVTFNVGVQTDAPTVDAAVAENSRRTADVLAALKKGGARPEEIQTSNFSINPLQDYTNGQRPRITGYQVMNNITVTRNNPADASRLLQAAVNAGVNQASGLSFIVSDPAKGRDEGLRKAFADARSKADLLAQAAGRKLGRALMIGEGSPGFQPPPPMPMVRAMSAKMEAPDVPVESGQNELDFQVSVTFALE